MPRKDVYHRTVVEALLADGWTITADPLLLAYGGRDVYVDVGAEDTISADRAGQKVGVEINRRKDHSMDTIDRYREIVRQLILDYARYTPSHGDIATEAVIDPVGNHFEAPHVGWDGPLRVHGAVIHIDIIDDKIWIQYDGTSPGVADELVEAGIPRDAIVLGFRPPRVRQYSGFALA